MKNELFYKIKLIFWFLSNPKFYKHFIFFIFWRIKRLVLLKPIKYFDINEWCKNFEVDLENLINILFQKKIIYNFINDKNKITSKINSLNFNHLGGSSHCDLIYNISIQKKPKKVLELGVAYGWSSYAFLLSQEFNENFLLVSNDMPYPLVKDTSYVGSAIPNKLKKNWKLFKYPDLSIIDKLLTTYGKFDLIHYDSDKSYEGRTRSYKKLFKSLNKTGIFISDDINDNLAFKDFVTKNNLRFYTIKYEDRYLGVVIKND